MADRKGDPAKQPPECTMRTDGKCPHLKDAGGGFEGERYACEICGERYFLDYEEMK